jgi:hypothetical protein
VKALRAFGYVFMQKPKFVLSQDLYHWLDETRDSSVLRQSRSSFDSLFAGEHSMV